MKNSGDQTYNFSPDGRTGKEIHEMREYGYVEVKAFAQDSEDGKGYYCKTCKWFAPHPNTMPENPSKHDGFCQKFDFRDRAFGCCSGWEQASSK